MSARLSPAVYRRRRIVVFGGLLVIVVALVWGIWALAAQPWRTADPGQETTGPTDPSNSGEPTDPADPDANGENEIRACAAQAIEVVPITDATTYAAGELPQLSIQLTNTGTVACTINVGTSTQKFTITSGPDTWWRSTDCQTEPSDMEVTLAAGETVTSSEPLEWDRTRSSVSTCDSDSRPRAPGGGASYHLSVEIGGFASDTTKQFMLR